MGFINEQRLYSVVSKWCHCPITWLSTVYMNLAAVTVSQKSWVIGLIRPNDKTFEIQLLQLT